MLKKFSKFVVASIFNALAYIVVLFIMTDILKVWYMASAVISIVPVTLITFAMNNLWTWKSPKSEVTIYRFLKYYVVAGVAAVFGLALLYIIVEYMKIWYLLGSILGSVIVVGGSFLAHYYWTWGKNEGTELDFIIRFLRKSKILLLMNRIGIKADV